MALSKESFLPDEADCAETWRQLRWTEGPECPECGSMEIQTRQKKSSRLLSPLLLPVLWMLVYRHYRYVSGGLQRGLSRWVYLIREMDKKRLINDIAKDLGLTYKTVLGMSHKVKEAIYDQREEWLDALTGEVEADDVHVKGG
jgi:transposase-like protein